MRGGGSVVVRTRDAQTGRRRQLTRREGRKVDAAVVVVRECAEEGVTRLRAAAMRSAVAEVSSKRGCGRWRQACRRAAYSEYTTRLGECAETTLPNTTTASRDCYAGKSGSATRYGCCCDAKQPSAASHHTSKDRCLARLQLCPRRRRPLRLRQSHTPWLSRPPVAYLSCTSSRCHSPLSSLSSWRPRP